MAGFGPRTRHWFTGAFDTPTPAQVLAWRSIASGRHTLVVAPTGSGKTLAAFLWALDRLASEPARDQAARTRVLYISPLKALGVDVERNLRAPLTGMAALPPDPEASADQHEAMAAITVGVRSGDTPTDERRRLARTPPDILITTPESLFLMLTSKARETLRGVDTVIVDEVHAVAGTKRGAHLAVSLERLDALLERPAQRVGLSATVRPVDEVARFLGGSHEVEVVRPPHDKPIELSIVVPVEDLTAIAEPTDTVDDALGSGPVRATVWPHVEERIVDLVCAHRSTIVFANSRRLAERLCSRLNEIWTERTTGEPLPDEGSLSPAAIMASGSSRGADPSLVLARAHHGSVSREQRARIEDDLKSGRLPAVVATSSLELGIDMGAVDLVIQVEAPPSVASGLQRVGRAEHRVDGVSRGVVFPKHRGDLLSSAVVAERMRTGEIEALSVPRNPLDVLAQQIVAMVAMDEWDVEALGALVRRSAPFAGLPSSALDAVLDMLAGRYPSDAFAELRPRLVWDREAQTLTARPGAQRLAVLNGGTIPDRGLFGVFLATGEGPGRRVGELDEEMVYESRVGDVFALGATSWRIDDITHDRVLVTPAPGQPGRLPFWHGDTIGRPAELGLALGSFVREVCGQPRDLAERRLRADGLDPWAVDNLLAYLDEQRTATGHLPDDVTIVVERFRDEIGDWRIAVHTPLGGRVHTPWALAIAQRIQLEAGVDVQVMPSDDGIVLRLPDVEVGLDAAPPVLDQLVFEPDDVHRAVTEAVAGSALFAARFRECAARSLLLPRRRPDRRTPLWQQRQRSAQLLGVASEHATFPIVLETMREVVQDVFDVPALADLMTRIATGQVRIVEVETPSPSPFARSLLFGYVGAFLYEGDAPLAERRAQALALDSTLLAELLGQAELRELLDADSLDRVEHELQRLTPERAARDAEDVADLLRVLGPLSPEALALRGGRPEWTESLVTSRRAVAVRMAGEVRIAAVEDTSRLRDALGTPPPMGVAAAFLEPVADPVGDLVARYARTHGPFGADAVATELGLGVAVVHATLQRLAGTGRLVSGEFRPNGSGTEWCDAEVLRLVRRRSLAALRREAEPVTPSDAGPVPACLAGRGRTLARHRGCARRRRDAPGRARARLCSRATRPALARHRLQRRPARRADRVRRGAVERPRVAARRRRLGVAAPGRRRRPADGRATAGRGPGAVAASGARGAGRRQCAVLPRRRPPGAEQRPRVERPRGERQHRERRAVAAGVGRVGHQRHAGAPAPPPAVHPPTPTRQVRRPPGASRPPGPPSAVRTAWTRGSMVTVTSPLDRPHEARSCGGRGAARTTRRGHPRGSHRGARARWFRGRLPGPVRVRGGRAGSSGLLRRGPGRRAVLRARSGRPAAGAGHRRRAGRRRARRHRPGEPLRGRAPLAQT